MNRRKTGAWMAAAIAALILILTPIFGAVVQLVILSTLFFCLFLASVFLLIPILYSLVKRRWRRLAILMAAPIGVFGLLYLGFWINSQCYFAENLRGYFGTRVSLPKPSFSYESERSFLGDGYTLLVYDLPDSIRKRFENPEDSFLADYPKKTPDRGKWKAVSWKKGPRGFVLEEVFNLAFSERAPELDEPLEAIRKALEKGTTYYGCFYYDPIDHVSDVDLIVVDLAERKLYLINHNT